ncbi:MAG: DNA recombination protein RmuC [Clostridiales bacterium]|nr:DNA recombination protein RmuC [Clostridiales bacterium]MDY2835949.1 DNA recombination protein RmuC [Candidatus Aphodomonas sp.]
METTVLNWIEQPAGMLACALLLLAGLMIPLFVKMARQKRFLENRMYQIETSLRDNIADFRDANGAERAADRDEMNRNLRGMNDSIVSVIGEMSRTQQQQLDSFGGQIRATSRADEERLERMSRNIDEKLQDYDRQMTRVTRTLDEKLAVNEQRLNEMRRTLDENMVRLQGENEKKLEQIRVTVDEKLNSTLDKRLGESFRTVSERLEQVYKGLGEMQNLAAGVGDLKKVLTNVKTRGVWGEVQLASLLEQYLAPGQYDVNVAVKPGSAERVEFAVRLPGRGDGDQVVYLPIDSKFPMEDYRRLMDASEAGDKDGTDAATAALVAAIKNEARRIHSKYIDPPHTTDFAIMFLPVEGLYAEVLRQNGIVEWLQNEYRIVVTGPTTLLALLNSLQMGFRTIAIEKRSSEVWELLGAVKTEFGKFAVLLDKTQKRLRMASDSIEDAARKTRTIQRKLSGVQALSEPDSKRLIDLGDDEGFVDETDTEE